MENLSGDGGVRVIVIFGASGYIGGAFCKEFNKRNLEFQIIWHTIPYHDIRKAIIHFKASLVINCAAFVPTPSVDLCKDNLHETTVGNAVFPSVLAAACEAAGVPLAHIGTACLYGDVKEYNESDPPTRDFNGYCGVYLSTKYLSEKVVRESCPDSYVWRIRLPFDEFDTPKNYLSKLKSFSEVWAHDNSLTHRGDFVKAALDMWELRAPFGVYNCCNPGHISAGAIISKMRAKEIILHSPAFVRHETTGSLLSTKKLTDTGVKIRPVEEAVEEALENWVPNV